MNHTEMDIYCMYCNKQLHKGDTVFEYARGVFNGEKIIAEETIDVWCKDCSDYE